MEAEVELISTTTAKANGNVLVLRVLSIDLLRKTLDAMSGAPFIPIKVAQWGIKPKTRVPGYKITTFPRGLG